MIISVPKEIQPQEDRVSLTPAGVQTLTQLGHTVYVQEVAGVASGFSDEEYIRKMCIRDRPRPVKSAMTSPFWA